MGPFVVSILSGILGNLGADSVRARVRGIVARRATIAASDRPHRPQTAPTRDELTPTVSLGPPVPMPGGGPLNGPGLARGLVRRRR